MDYHMRHRSEYDADCPVCTGVESRGRAVALLALAMGVAWVGTFLALAWLVARCVR